MPNINFDMPNIFMDLQPPSSPTIPAYPEFIPHICATLVHPRTLLSLYWLVISCCSFLCVSNLLFAISADIFGKAWDYKQINHQTYQNNQLNLRFPRLLLNIATNVREKLFVGSHFWGSSFNLFVIITNINPLLVYCTTIFTKCKQNYNFAEVFQNI